MSILASHSALPLFNRRAVGNCTHLTGSKFQSIVCGHSKICAAVVKPREHTPKAFTRLLWRFFSGRIAFPYGRADFGSVELLSFGGVRLGLTRDRFRPPLFESQTSFGGRSIVALTKRGHHDQTTQPLCADTTGWYLYFRTYARKQRLSAWHPPKIMFQEHCRRTSRALHDLYQWLLLPTSPQTELGALL